MLLFISALSIYGQSDDCLNDTIAPTFSLPMYLTDGIIYPCLDSVPLLWGEPYPDIADIVFSTLIDNCDPTPSLTSSIFQVTNTLITYSFTSSDDSSNNLTQLLTFYFNENCDPSTSIEEYNIKNNQEYELYNLNGKRVYYPLERGIYLKRYKTHTEKILVK